MFRRTLDGHPCRHFDRLSNRLTKILAEVRVFGFAVRMFASQFLYLIALLTGTI
jgi:hypothetical protein